MKPINQTPPAAGQAAHTLSDGHAYQGMHIIHPDAGLVYYLAGTPSRGWLAGEVKAALNTSAANEARIAALVGALKTSIASLEWAAVAMPDIPANSTFRTDLAAAKVILAEAEQKPSV